MSVQQVLSGERRHWCEQADALQFLRALPDDSVDLLFTSPPYTDARDYAEAQAARDTAAWVEWLRPIVRESCRVSKCLAFFNVSDRVKQCVYQGGPELLFADLTRVDRLSGVRPYAWVKSGPGFDDPGNGTPGSGAKHFHRNDWEPVYGFSEPHKLPPTWSDNTAFGLPPKWESGGPGTHRSKSGKRANDGKKYIPPPISNPGNVLRVMVGGGHLGHPMAHDGEAPMPVAVAERFVCWFCPPDGIVCDPFTGSGTTADAAFRHNRRFVGCDLRQSQVDLCRRRMATVTPDLAFA